MLRTAIAVCCFVLAAPALAAAPAGQGKVCSAKDKCEAGLSCVQSGDGRSTCQILCNAKTKCPEDQRCVKDNGRSICRPINDADL